MIYFTSDLHFNHKNIIKYCNRPWNSTKEMNEAIIKNFNEILMPNDTLYILGDCGFGCKQQIEQIKGKKILIVGNHDEINDIKNVFEEVTVYKKLKYNHKHFILFHYPILEWDGKYHNTYHLHGHQHNTADYNTENIENNILRYDVGVDANNYKPISIEEIITKFKIK